MRVKQQLCGIVVLSSASPLRVPRYNRYIRLERTGRNLEWGSTVCLFLWVFRIWCLPGLSGKTKSGTSRIFVHLGASVCSDWSLHVGPYCYGPFKQGPLGKTVMKQLWDDLSLLIVLYWRWVWMHKPFQSQPQGYIILWRDMRISREGEGHWLETEAAEVPH